MLAEEDKLIIAFHSYKGGTGKTLIAVNLATTLASRGKNVCLLDLDFRAPSLYAIFKPRDPRCWVNDYLNGACDITHVLVDCSRKHVARGTLCVGFADPSIEAIRDLIARDRKWEMRALGRLLALKDALLEDAGFDYVIFDTSPGLQYTSINAVICADLVFVVATPDASDIEGTRRMIRELYKLFQKKTRVLANRVPAEFVSARRRPAPVADLESPQSPVVEVVACSCDILCAGECFFACRRPNHPFTRAVQAVADEIERCEL
jgi:MinD-like ATPase involved in chromosome partitioning or flagellar assembly